MKHCILAHHGELEYGSPKKPALAEALALSFADNIDAKEETIREDFCKCSGRTIWSGRDITACWRAISADQEESHRYITGYEEKRRIELKIEDMGVDGEGIGKYEGMTFFVKDAVIGDTIRAGITKLKKNYGYARVQRF